MGSEAILIILVLCILANFVNVCMILKLRYGEKYLIHMSMPVFVEVLFFVVWFIINNKHVSKNTTSFQSGVLMISIISTVGFSILNSLIVLIKSIVDREYDNIGVIILFAITSIMVTGVNIIGTCFIYIILMLSKKKDKSAYSNY